MPLTFLCFNHLKQCAHVNSCESIVNELLSKSRLMKSKLWDDSRKVVSTYSKPIPFKNPFHWYEEKSFVKTYFLTRAGGGVPQMTPSWSPWHSREWTWNTRDLRSNTHKVWENWSVVKDRVIPSGQIRALRRPLQVPPVVSWKFHPYNPV